MTADALLCRLEKARQTGPNRWLACCPAHDDHHPSLAIRELDDGRVLLHCFSRGCSADAIVAAVGLSLADLFPERAIEHAKPERRPFPAADVLRAVAFEALVVDCAAGTIQRKGYLTDAECDRLALASDRLQAAVGLVAHG